MKNRYNFFQYSNESLKLELDFENSILLQWKPSKTKQILNISRLTFNADDVFTNLLGQKLIRNEFDQIVNGVYRRMHWFEALNFVSNWHRSRILNTSTKVLIIILPCWISGTWARTAQKCGQIHRRRRGSSWRSFHFAVEFQDFFTLS